MDRVSKDHRYTETETETEIETRPIRKTESKTLDRHSNFFSEKTSKAEFVTSAGGLWRKEEPRTKGSAHPPKARLALHPERLPCFQMKEGRSTRIGSRLMRGLNQLCDRSLAFQRRSVGQVDVRQCLMRQNGELSGAVHVGLLRGLDIEGRDHRAISSLTGRIELGQALPGFFDTPLLRPDAIAKGEADTNAGVFIVQQLVGAVERVLGTLHAKASFRHLKIKHFDHRPDSFMGVVPSLNQPPNCVLVPAAPCRAHQAEVAGAEVLPC